MQRDFDDARVLIGIELELWRSDFGRRGNDNIVANFEMMIELDGTAEGFEIFVQDYEGAEGDLLYT